MDRLKQAWQGSKLKKIWNWIWIRKVDIGVWSFIPAALVGAILTIVLYIGPVLDGPKENADRVTLIVGTAGAVLVGIVGLLNLYVNYRRTRAFESTEKRQREIIKQQRESDRRRDQQQLYATNVQHLGHESESVRIGAIYGLERLAKESEDSDEPWASKIAEILCAHIRITTSDDSYLSRGKTKLPHELSTVRSFFASNEINTALVVLAKGDNNPFDSTKFDLTWTHLKGAFMSGVNLAGSQLWYSNLNGAISDRANLNGASLWRADLIDTNLKNAGLIGAYLKDVKLRGTKLNGARLEGSYSGDSGKTKTDHLKTRIDKPTDLTECKFKDGEQTDLRDVSCGVLTQGLYDAIMQDRVNRVTGIFVNEYLYRIKHSVKRKPTEEEKEQLVGKDNVDKCIWGDIIVLEEKDTQGNSEVK